MQNFIKILYSNEEIINQRKAHWLLVLIIFFVSWLMIATPFVTSKLIETPTQLGQQFPEVRDSLVDIFKEFDCQIINETLDCGEQRLEVEKENITYFINVKEGDEVKAVQNYVVFGEHQIVLKNMDAEVIGDYSLLNNTSFKDLLKIMDTEKIDETTLANHFIQNVNQSTLSKQIPMIYSSVLIQYIVYVGLISVVYMAINMGRLKKKYSFWDILRMMVLALFSPALLSAIVGLFNPLVGSAAFPLLYMSRVIFIYFKLLKDKELGIK